MIPLVQGEPIIFGAEGEHCVVRDEHGGLLVAATDSVDPVEIVVHDANLPTTATAFALTRLSDPETLHHTPIGVLRSVERPSYNRLMNDQMALAAKKPADLQALLAGNDTWDV